MSSVNIPLLPLNSGSTSIHDAVEDEEPWAQYVPVAADYDKRIVDEWTKLVDTVLVFNGLFVGILSAFALSSGNGLQRDSGDIADDLLVAIYTRLSNASAPVVDVNSIFSMDPGQEQVSVYLNTLLYSSLAISVIAALIAAIAKLWILRYSRTVASYGESPFEHAMKRQEIYNGAVAWRLNEIIEALPILIVIAVSLFAIYIQYSISDLNIGLGYIVGIIFDLGLVFIFVTSSCAAFIPTSPFQSAFSDFIRLMFKICPDYPLTKRDKSPTIIRTSCVIVASAAVAIAVAFLSVRGYAAGILVFLCVPVAGACALFTSHPEKIKTMKPRMYELPGWILFSSCTTVVALVVAAYYYGSNPYFIAAFVVGCALIAVHGYHAIQISKFAPDTTMTEAVIWMLRNSSSHRITWFRKARDIGSTNVEGTKVKRAVLFHKLLPLLSPLILSIPHSSEHSNLRPDQVEYVACLAQLCKFTPSVGSFWKNLWNNEVSFPGPRFTEDVREKLKHLRDCNRCPKEVQEDAMAALQSEYNSRSLV